MSNARSGDITPADPLPVAPLPVDSALQAILVAWQKHLTHTQRRSAHTCEAYTQDVWQFMRHHASHSAQLLTLEHILTLSTRDIRAYVAACHTHAISARSQARKLSALRHFYRYLERSGHGVQHAVQYFRVRTQHHSAPRAIAADSLLAMLNDCQHLSETLWIQHRDQLMIGLLYGAGLRIGEALALNVRAILPDSSTLRVQGKGNKQREVPLLPLIHQLHSQYITICPYINATTPSDAPLLYGARGGRLQAAIFQKHFRILRGMHGLDESATPHSMRHSFASHLLGNGAGLRDVQALLGHASLASTQIYTEVDAPILQQHYLQAHPMSQKQSQKKS